MKSIKTSTLAIAIIAASTIYANVATAQTIMETLPMLPMPQVVPEQIDRFTMDTQIIDRITMNPLPYQLPQPYTDPIKELEETIKRMNEEALNKELELNNASPLRKEELKLELLELWTEIKKLEWALIIQTQV